MCFKFWMSVVYKLWAQISLTKLLESGIKPRGDSRALWHTHFNINILKEQAGGALSLGPAWSAEQVPG